MEEIINGLYRIRTSASSIYIIERPKNLILIDTGFQRNPKKILDAIKTIKSLTDKELSSIFISHFHIDHTAGLWKIEKEYPSAQIFASSLEIPFILKTQKQPKGEGFLGSIIKLSSLLMRYHPPEKITEFPKDLEQIEIFHLPGHTPGHSGFYLPDTKTLLSIDLFQLSSKKIKPTPKFLNVSNKQNIDSIKQIYTIINQQKLEINNILPSHGKVYLKDAGKQFIEMLTENFG